MITSRMKRRMKRDMSIEKPTVWVGKEGSTEQIVNEVSRQLERHEIVKARVQQTALKDVETKEVATKIAERTGSTLIDVRGHTFVLYRKRKPKKPKGT